MSGEEQSFDDNDVGVSIAAAKIDDDDEYSGVELDEFGPSAAAPDVRDSDDADDVRLRRRPVPARARIAATAHAWRDECAPPSSRAARLRVLGG